jgi:death-on-curing protein
MKYLDAEEILLIHHQLIERYGGSHGTRDLSRVKSVAAAPAQAVFRTEQYQTVFEKAAVYARNIIGDHPFNDGNTRTGRAVAAMFLKRNGYNLTPKQGELEDFAVRVATEKLDVSEIAGWLNQHSRQA